MEKKETFSVTKILFYYFDLYPKNNNIIRSQNNYLGLFIHKIVSLYYKYNKQFNILKFLETKKDFFDSEEIDKIILIIDKLKEILNNKKWKILFFEKNFFYNNLYGKPDAIYKYNYFSLNFYSSCFLKYFYKIKSNCINKDIFLNSFTLKQYDKNKKNIILIDWKCSTRNIFFNDYKEANNYLKKFFYNTLYNKFLIQMNIYKYILEKNHFNVMEMYICILNIKNFSINFIPLYFLKNDFIENIINKYQNQIY